MEVRMIKVRDLMQGYLDNGENGVVGYDGKLNIRPAYQREYIYNEKQRNAVLTSIAKERTIGLMHWSDNGDGTFELLDGQQRTISICQYCTNEFAMEFELGVPRTFANISEEFRNKILDYEILVASFKGTDEEKLEWFRTINIAGVALTDQELLNAVYTGRWLTDAKRRFSKTNCVAFKIGNKLLTGTPIRQDYLETALYWISNGEKGGIAKYMSEHQNDTDALELWRYFQNVIDWVTTKFKVYRREMKGIDWGLLYNQYKDNTYDADALEEQIKVLMADDDVTAKKGIYEYLLSGGAKENKLNIRAFTESQKRAAYERQGGICPICGEHHDYEDMEGDHITPWSKGGKTIPENLQMICKSCNRKKSDK
jgi:hypothetical protein